MGEIAREKEREKIECVEKKSIVTVADDRSTDIEKEQIITIRGLSVYASVYNPLAGSGQLENDTNALNLLGLSVQQQIPP